MEGWQQDWFKMFDTLASEMEQFIWETTQGIAEAIDSAIEFSCEVVEEIQVAIASDFDDLDLQIETWIEPVLQALLGEASIDQTADALFAPVEPFLNSHPVCVGCRHYHGRVYGGNLLVCAMHPYGMTDDSESCPDKEAISWRFSSDRNLLGEDEF
jgi:hypothetical protein